MATDYQAMTAEHIRLYGESEWYAELLADMYVDRTHFLRELIQNAEDARATKMLFHLHPDGLELRHDGRPFNTHDVRGVCGLRDGTKADDPEQIGRFGIGFKSVYAYTRVPEVHSGDEHFRIESYVRPRGTDPLATESDWTTLIRLPFDRPDIPQRAAAAQVRAGLKKLNQRLLLFLRHVREIQWIEGEDVEVLLREEQEWRGLRRLHIQGTTGSHDPEDWLVFSQAVEGGDVGPSTRVELGFLIVAGRDGEWRMRPARDTELVVFFPTAQATGLGYLLQGPFVPTATRDNVRWPHDFNRLVIESAAELLPEALSRLAGARLIDIESLKALALAPDAHQSDNLFRPMVLAAREAVGRLPLVLAHCGELVPAGQSRMPAAAWLRDLLGCTALSELVGTGSATHWVSPALTDHRTPDLYAAFAGHRFAMHDDWEPLVPGFRLDPEGVLALLDDGLMERQRSREGVGWVLNLYERLAELRTSRNLNRMKAAPIIPLEGGGWSRAEGDDGKPLVWLPAEADTDFATADRAVATAEGAWEFLRTLGLSKPDLADEAMRNVLPKYRTTQPPPLDGAEHLRDVRLVVRALATSGEASQQRLRRELADVPLLGGVNAATGVESRCAPTDLHVRTERLAVFLAGNPRAHLLHDRYGELSEELRLAGVRDDVAVTARRPLSGGYVVTKSAHGEHERGLDGFDPAFDIQGLRHALESPSIPRSRVVWDLLAQHVKQIRGVVESATRQDYSNARRTAEPSIAGRLASECRWLPNREGEFKRARELSLDELPDGFDHYAELASSLGMTAEPDIVANTLGVSREELSLVMDNRRALKRFLGQLRREADRAQAPGGDEREPLRIESIVEEISAHLSREPIDAEPVEQPRRGESVNPDLRRERGVAQLREDVDSEPVSARRWRLAEHRALNDESAEVRQYLFERYAGGCQICGRTFTQANGLPYFEAVRLVSRTRAKFTDRAGLALSLCATCSAMLRYGPVDLLDFLDRAREFLVRAEGGTGTPQFHVRLCDEDAIIHYDERHLIDLQAVLRSGTPTRDPATGGAAT